jgi:hypothetical protein
LKQHYRLLQLAQAMTIMDRRRPRQATLRRAVSTAYYAVYHLLTSEYAALFSDDPTISASLARTLNHKDIAGVARDFSHSKPVLPKAIKDKGLVIPREIIEVAEAFLDLQDERHLADYDLSQNYTRKEVQSLVVTARKAFSNWELVKNTPMAKLFLACFQLKKAWDTER